MRIFRLGMASLLVTMLPAVLTAQVKSTQALRSPKTSAGRAIRPANAEATTPTPAVPSMKRSAASNAAAGTAANGVALRSAAKAPKGQRPPVVSASQRTIATPAKPAKPPR